jgi:SAM-dependent methyltransferase
MLDALKAALPWWAKIVAKIILARLPVGGAFWQRLGLFSPGNMTAPEYAFGVFERFYSLAGKPSGPFSFLELGPGDSLASAVIGFGLGAEQVWLVDAGSYASRDQSVYGNLITYGAEKYPDGRFGTLDPAQNLDDLLVSCGAHYMEDGLESLKEIPDASCDFIFSNAVLEHVPRAEFSATMAEIFRILKPSGRCHHQIDFQDHLGAEYNNLRFSEKLWEAPWFAQRSGFYTNRLQCSEIEAIMKDAGFIVTVFSALPRDCTPADRGTFHADFSNLDDGAFTVKDALFILEKPQKTGK